MELVWGPSNAMCKRCKEDIGSLKMFKDSDGNYYHCDSTCK